MGMLTKQGGKGDVEAGDTIKTPLFEGETNYATSSSSSKLEGANNRDPSKHLLRLTILSSIGSVFEWMDFSLYAYLAKSIGKTFFPHGDTRLELIKTFSVFAASFVVRPIGGLLFGYIGDHYGKKKSLYASILLMAFSTTCMGLLPGYKHIGVTAPILLTFFRCLQGLAVGGQLVGAIVFVDSHAPPHTKGFYGGVSKAAASCGTLLGSIVGSLMNTFMSPQDLQNWGFRIPFLCGFIVAVAGYLMHTMVPDIHEEQAKASGGGSGAARARHGTPLTDLLYDHKWEMVLGTIVISISCTGFYVDFVWLASYFKTLVPNAPIPYAFWINTFWLTLYVLCLPLCGWLADKIGAKPVMIFGAWWTIISAPLAFLLFNASTVYAAFLGQGLLFVGQILVGGPQAMYLTTIATSSRHKFTALAIMYNVAQAAFGGTAALIATAAAGDQNGMGPGIFVAGVAGGSLIGMLLSNWDRQWADRTPVSTELLVFH